MLGYTLGFNDIDLKYIKNHGYKYKSVQFTCGFSDDGSKFTKRDLNPLLDLVKEGCEIVVHSPLNLSICSDKDNVRNWSWSTVHKLLDTCSNLGFKYLVVHGGRSLHEILMKTDIINNLRLIDKTYKGSCTLVLENLTGTKAGYNTGSANFIADIVREVKLPWVKMCWDTNHHFGNANDIDMLEFAKNNKDIIKVIHLNSVPPGTVRGGCQDRHSHVLIEECEGGYSWLNEIHKMYPDTPQILERKEIELMEKDIKFLLTL